MQNSPDPIQEQSPSSPKIFFSQKVFGKPTKNRADDPSMFELLAWADQSTVEAGDFKKKQRFHDPQTAYMSKILKQPWLSESQQNYVNYNQNSIDVNQQIFREVENYINHHQAGKKQSKPAKGQDKLVKKSRNNINQQTANKKTTQQQQKQIPTQQFTRTTVQQQKIQQTYKQQQKPTRNRPSSAMNIKRSQTTKDLFTPQDDQSYNTSTIKRQDQLSEEQQQRLIQKFKQTTRWIPNSSFTTYFGKPPFENYGRGNTKPIDGGLVYGTYLYSHNVFPHRGANSPSHIQSYPVALMKAKSMGKLIPTQPKTICKYLENKINNQKERQYDAAGSIEALKNTFEPLEIQTPNLKGVQKFGGTKSTASRTKLSSQQQNGYTTYQGKKYSSKKL